MGEDKQNISNGVIVLETKNLTKKFHGVYALNNLSIAIRKGIISAIIGPNGSGKTTLFNILTGVFAPDGGEITIGPTKFKKVISYYIYRYGVVRTFQDIRLFNQMTVLDNVLVALTKRSVFSALFEKSNRHYLKKAEEVLKRVNLYDKKTDLAVNLSYGQRKLLEIARTIATNADIYLFDEPFAGLSPLMLEAVSGIIKELRQKGKTIVLIDHNINLIRETANYVFVLESGRLLARGNPNEVLERQEVIGSYLGK